jgi:23S rRNA (guanine745-N1)-methyltransferase
VIEGSRLTCEASHSFDLAKKGYVNLLPSHHRKSKSAGDSEDMVSSRRNFLAAGHYEPLAIGVVDMLRGGTAAHADIGCGEGYFTLAMTEAASDVYGVDISKAAISAASRHKQLNLAVGNLTSLPLQAGKFDSISVIMAPFPNETAIEVLRPSGRLIRVSPGERHLTEFKAFMYEENRAHKRASLDHEGLRHIQEETLEFQMALDAVGAQSLIEMTPMRHRSRRAIPASVRQEGLEVTAHFWIDVFERDKVLS